MSTKHQLPEEVSAHGASQPPEAVLTETAPQPAHRPASAWDRLRLLARLAGLSYLGISLIARLPVAMLPLSTLVMMAAWTHQILIAGYAAGTVALSIAVSVPVYGIIVRRAGQRFVLLFCVAANIASTLWLVHEAVEIQKHATSNVTWLLVACAVTGASCAPVAAMARIRWAGESQRLADKSLLNSSLAFESVADVSSIVLGAAVTGIGSVIWHPHAGLIMVIAINLFAVTAFAFYGLRHSPTPEFRPQGVQDPERRSVGPSMMWLPVAGMGTLGLLLGSMQSSLVSFTINFDAIEYVGLLYAVLGISSLISAVIIVLMRVRTASWGAWLVWASLLTLVGLPVSMPGSNGTLVISLVAEGIVVGIAMIVTDSVALSIAPLRFLDLVMTSSLASLLAGIALGLAWGAVLGDSTGYNSALMLPLLSAGSFLVLAHIYGYLWRQKFEDRLSHGRHGTTTRRRR